MQKSKVKNILQQEGLKPLKKFGQNFLVSQKILNKIIATASLKPNDVVLEIGPGLGALTFELAKKAKKIIAVEKDKKIAEILKQNLTHKNITNVEVINADALKSQKSPKESELPTGQAKGKSQNDNSKVKINGSKNNWEVGPFLPEPYKLVANLPYNIATAVIMKFLEIKHKPELMVVMTQKEVGQRICASPPHMNKLAVFCQLYSAPKIIAFVPSSAFYPKPKIDSAILRLKVCDTRCRSVERHRVSHIINIGFSHPRKTLLNNLVRGLTPHHFAKEKISQWLLQNNIQPSQRPQTLSVDNWLALAKTFKTLHNN